MAYLCFDKGRDSEPRRIQIGEKRVPMFRWSRGYRHAGPRSIVLQLALSLNHRKKAKEKRKKKKGKRKKEGFLWGIA